MRILLISNDPDNINAFLTETGYKVQNCQSTNMVEKLLKPDDIIIFSDSVFELRITQEDVLRYLGKTQQRIILICDRQSPLVMMASAFGVKDFIFPPLAVVDILSILQTPATSEDAAKKLSTVKLPVEEEQKPSRFKNLGAKLGRKLGRKRQDEQAEDSQDEEPNRQEKPSFFKTLGTKLGRKRQNSPEETVIPQEKPRVQKERPLKTPPERVKRIAQPFALRDGELEKVVCSPGKPEQLFKYSVIFLPDSWPASAIKKIRRNPQAKSIYIVVVGDNKEFLAAGADRLVPELNALIVEEVTFASERLKKLWLKAETDNLTGCYTRGFWDEWLAEQKNAQIFICDLDHFKTVNDTHGHPYGDKVLKEFANFLQTNIRPTDILCRWGGEEFVVGMPQTSAQDAYYIGTRLCQKWERASTKLFGEKKLTVTFSGGLGKTVKEADKNLYKAKESGRNRVVSATTKIIEEKAVKQTVVKLFLGPGRTREEIKAILPYFFKRGSAALICDATGEVFPDYPEYPAEPKFWVFDLPGGQVRVIQAEAWQAEQIKTDLVILPPDATNVLAKYSFCFGNFKQYPMKAILLSNIPHRTRKTLPLTRQAMTAYVSGRKQYIVSPTTSFLSRINQRLRVIPKYLSSVLNGVKHLLSFLFQSFETIFWLLLILILIITITWVIVGLLGLFDVDIPIWITTFFERLDYLIDSVVYR